MTVSSPKDKLNTTKSTNVQDSSHEEIKIHKGTSFLAHKVDESFVKFIGPQMGEFGADETKFLSQKINGFTRAKKEHTHILKATNITYHK